MVEEVVEEILTTLKLVALVVEDQEQLVLLQDLDVQCLVLRFYLVNKVIMVEQEVEVLLLQVVAVVVPVEQVVMETVIQEEKMVEMVVQD